jgi:plasmid maintenance system antidote protein VapI
LQEMGFSIDQIARTLDLTAPTVEAIIAQALE